MNSAERFLTEFASVKKENQEMLTPRQLAVIPHLIASPSVEEACRRAKISKPTVYSYLKEETFLTELNRQRDEVYKESLASLKAGSKRAVGRLLKLVESKREEIALRACTQIISANLKITELAKPDKNPFPDTPFTLENVRQAWRELEAAEENAACGQSSTDPEAPVA